jgi:hypothetical protein
VLAAVPWCDVTIDGVAPRRTPMTLALPPGHHTVVLFEPHSAMSRRLALTLHAGETLHKRVVASR